MIAASDVDAFWRDGVVCLRGVLSPGLVRAMEAPVAAAHSADLSELAGAPRGRGRFVAGVDHWLEQPELRAFAVDSPLPALVGALLRTSDVFLYEDSVLVKEPGAAERTMWHQDLGYFHVDGTQVCTTWCPLDPATADSGAMQFVRGSHRWDATYRPNLFVTTESLPGTDGDDVPDIDGGDFDVITFDLEPGDITVHHARTLHAAGGNHTTHTRRAISVRYCGDDVRIRFRPGAPAKPTQAGLRDGDALGGAAHPLVFRHGMS
ncbi:MAG: phytanoyl-CoA dioxygenase family protein [Actinomycetota bacterium]|nr:phytanoyl-CoA dioxygenase family protein [Actinomycetota bacterium]